MLNIEQIRRGYCWSYDMQINYYEIGLVVLLAAVVLIWLIVRNRKDEKAFEKDELTDTIDSPDPEKD